MTPKWVLKADGEIKKTYCFVVVLLALVVAFLVEWVEGGMCSCCAAEKYNYTSTLGMILVRKYNYWKYMKIAEDFYTPFKTRGPSLTFSDSVLLFLEFFFRGK